MAHFSAESKTPMVLPQVSVRCFEVMENGELNYFSICHSPAKIPFFTPPRMTVVWWGMCNLLITEMA
jgi:hypothetical protein